MSRLIIFAALFAALLPGTPADSQASEPEQSETTTAITLPWAVQRTLAYNPDLRRAYADHNVYVGLVTQAGLIRNPQLAIEAEDLLGTGSLSGLREAEFTLRLEQDIQAGGKRKKARTVAQTAADLSAVQLRAMRVEVLSDLSRAFTVALAAQELLAMRERLLRIAAENVTAVVVRVRKGVANEAELAKARIAESEARLAWIQARQQLHIARRELSRFWGEMPPRFSHITGDLYAFEPVPALDGLLDRLEQAPALMAARSGIDLAIAERVLADARRIPDLTIGAGAKWLNGPGGFAAVGGISLPLPVFDRNQGARAAAVARIQGRQAEKASIELRLRTQLSSYWYDLVAITEALREFRESTLPQARKAYDMSRALFERGRFSYLELLDAQRTLFLQLQQQIQTLVAYHTTIADIEGLLGTTIVGLPKSDIPEDELR